MATPGTNGHADNGAVFGFDEEPRQAADWLRGQVDAAAYKNVISCPTFPEFISDAFEGYYAELDAEHNEETSPEDPDDYRAVNIFWVPKAARWSHVNAEAKQPTIGQLVDHAMVDIERDNPALKGAPLRDCSEVRR